jgi:hypothetical protein
MGRDHERRPSHPLCCAARLSGQHTGMQVLATEQRSITTSWNGTQDTSKIGQHWSRHAGTWKCELERDGPETYSYDLIPYAGHIAGSCLR